MQRIIPALLVPVILVLSIFSIDPDRSFPMLFSFCLLPIVWSGYLYGLKFSLFVSLLSSGAALSLIAFGIQPLSILGAVLVFNIAVLISHRFRKIFKNYQDTFRLQLQEIKGSYQDLLREDEEVNKLNLQLDRDVSKIEDLYEVTKEMGVSLEFVDIFETFARILKKTFKFKRCRLILLGQVNGVPSIEQVYQVPGPTSPVNPTPCDQELLELVSSEMRPIVIDSPEKNPYPERLHLPPEIKSFICAPLVIQNKAIAVLTGEDLEIEDFEKFLILAGQFAIQMEKVKLYEKVQELAITDGLTGAFVRRHFLKRVDEELKRSVRHKMRLSFLMLDIDHFKDCNDKYGHLVGDVVLREITQILKANLREVDLVSRYGGEEFSIVLPETDRDQALAVAERIRTSVENYTFKAYDETLRTSISIGLAVFPNGGDNPGKLIDSADQALYRAKESGRNRVCVYEEKPDTSNQ